MSENDKKVPLIIRDFHTNRGMWTHLVFSKEEILRFHTSNFANGKSLGRKVLFFQPPWDNQNFNNFETFCVYSCCPSHNVSRTI